jgi:conjugative relaxase-like TrwC/TraI family protein
MARFAVMGKASVAYHEQNALGREDDHAGQALDYYGSRGETPLRWAGAGAARLGLEGEVRPEHFRSVFAEGGFIDPVTGERLVKAKRPGFELVVDAHKSVAVLGVMNRADDMHAILDGETEATMAHLEGLFAERGGSRGRARLRTATGGLTYAVTRHGTSRAGDPHPHDHILIPNVVEMLDTRGGWKALDSAALRDWLEAATMVGRLHSAARAVELGYAVEPDGGTTGRKRAWRIAGIPDEVCELYSKRRTEIDEYMATRGYDSPQARKMAALNTRDIKRFTGVEELMPRWQAELREVGWGVERLGRALTDARSLAQGFRPALTTEQVDDIATRLFDVRGDFLRRSKVFTRSRLIAEVAPLLYGHIPTELDGVLNDMLANREVVPLIGVDGAREQPFSTATVLATETRIAQTVERLAADPFATVPEPYIDAAIAAKQERAGFTFTAGQHAAAREVAMSGRRVDVIVGVAGSGKTTALDSATSALEHAGFRVIGTATSGQAARTLGEEARIEANTLARLIGRLDRGELALDRHTVVVLDEAAMTADADLLRLVVGVERAGAKLVLVGDHRQLTAIGPGGAFAAVLDRHPDLVVEVTENMRQRDGAERATLDDLRDGSVSAAVDWYGRNQRIIVAATRLDALQTMVDSWHADVEAGRNSPMLAWRRRDTDDLNQLARMRRREMGHISGPDLEAPGGQRYAMGDRVLITAPNNPQGLVTSERATVIFIDHPAEILVIRTDGGRRAELAGKHLDADHLTYGYAMTIHRTQALTVDRTHLFADGGGRISVTSPCPATPNEPPSTSSPTTSTRPSKTSRPTGSATAPNAGSPRRPPAAKSAGRYPSTGLPTSPDSEPNSTTSTASPRRTRQLPSRTPTSGSGASRATGRASNGVGPRPQRARSPATTSRPARIGSKPSTEATTTCSGSSSAAAQPVPPASLPSRSPTSATSGTGPSNPPSTASTTRSPMWSPTSPDSRPTTGSTDSGEQSIPTTASAWKPSNASSSATRIPIEPRSSTASMERWAFAGLQNPASLNSASDGPGATAPGRRCR